MQAINIKRGATLQMQVVISAFGVDMSSVSISSEVRDSRQKKIADLSFEPTNMPGQYLVLQPTEGWPIGTLLADFKLSQGSLVLKSDTLAIVVGQDISR